MVITLLGLFTAFEWSVNVVIYGAARACAFESLLLAALTVTHYNEFTLVEAIESAYKSYCE